MLSATFTPAADEETVFSLRRCRPDSSFSLQRQPVCSSAAGRAVVHWAANRCSPRSTWEVFITLCADPEPLPREQAYVLLPLLSFTARKSTPAIRSHSRSGLSRCPSLNNADQVSTLSSLRQSIPTLLPSLFSTSHQSPGRRRERGWRARRRETHARRTEAPLHPYPSSLPASGFLLRKLARVCETRQS